MGRLNALAKEIKELGVTRVFGVPGSGSSLDLIDALEKCGIHFHLTHSEAAAAIMAGTLGHLDNRAGLAVSIKGPGLANMIPGLAFCYFEGYPLVAISEAYAPESPTFKTHKRLDHEKLTSAVVKGRRVFAEKGPSFSELMKWAQAEVPAPVLFDLPDAPTAFQEPITYKNKLSSSGGILDVVKKSAKPVIIAGTLAIRQGLSKRLNALQIPVFSTAAAKGVIDETLAHAAGVYTGAGLEFVPERSVLQSADLVIGIGLSPNEVLKPGPFHCLAVNVSAFEDKFTEAAFDFAFTENCEESEGLFEILLTKEWGLGELALSLQRLRNYMLEKPFLPAHVFAFLEQYFNDKACIVVDTGNFCTIAEHIWQSKNPFLYLSSGQSRYMGMALPMGIAAALHNQSRPTIVVVGDGGIGPFIAEIKLAIRHRLPLLLLLMSDGRFGSIVPRARKDSLTLTPLIVEDPSWLAVLNGFGISGFLVKSEDDLRNALGQWNLKSGPLFLEIPFAPEIYEEMVNGIR